MSKRKIYFIGLLANVDSSILNVKLDYDFKISTREDFTLFSILEGLSKRQIISKFLKFHCLSDKRLYYVSNSFESDIEIDNDGILIYLPPEWIEFNNNCDLGYLDPVIRLMRLFKEGNICIPLKYYYFFTDNNIPKLLSRMESISNISSEAYRLEDSEIPDLQEFIQKMKLPFKESFLQLAFENFESSYQATNINLSFLSLMISLETLFNPGEELRYRVSRNTAVLLGKDKGDSERIFSEIKDLYDKRSKIVHTGVSNIIEEDLLKLRYYVRESIKEINEIGKNKDELLGFLNSCGFGERPRKNRE